jgi:DNA-binding NarL/FixJ family response regulator
MTQEKDDRTYIVVADDHTILVDGIVQILRAISKYHVVATAHNGQEVIDILKKERVDLIIMDINMPIMDGIDATEIISERFEETKVLIMSMHNKAGYIQNAIKAGASGYILKNTSPDELEEAIGRVMEGGSYFSQDVSNLMAMSMKGLTEKKKVIKLSRQEKLLLRLLSEGETSEHISDRMDTSVHTISSYRRNLLIKFDAKNVTHLVSLAIKEGFLLQ